MRSNLLSILLVASALSLSACETFMNDQFMKADQEARTQSGGLLTPLTPKLKTDDTRNLPQYDTSVNVMDYQNAPVMQQNMAPPVPMTQTGFGYGAGVPTGDPSVTIFPLDGESPVYGFNPNAPMVNYQNDFVAQNNMAPVMGGGVEGQIFFKHGSSRLGIGDINKLSNVAEQAKFAPVNRITVEGYASQPTQAGSQSVEGHILNLKESMNRSFAVSKKLMQKGVPAEKIKTVSWGSTKASGNESQDRRVDIVMGER